MAFTCVPDLASGLPWAAAENGHVNHMGSGPAREMFKRQLKIHRGKRPESSSLSYQSEIGLVIISLTLYPTGQPCA